MTGLDEHEVVKIRGLLITGNYSWHLVEKSAWLCTKGNACGKWVYLFLCNCIIILSNGYCCT